MKKLERSIEAAVVRYAQRCGIPKEGIVKLNGFGKRSLPDRMFLYRGEVLFIEFKREGARPTPLQEHLHARWRRLGHKVHIVDTVAQGKLLIDWFTSVARHYPLEDCI